MFDRNLVTATNLDTANWSIRYNDVDYPVTLASTGGKRAMLVLSTGGADVGIDRVTFAPPPADVITKKHADPVVAFTDLPLT